MVRVKGLEPPYLAVPEPKSGASASSATPAQRRPSKACKRARGGCRNFAPTLTFCCDIPRQIVADENAAQKGTIMQDANTGLVEGSSVMTLTGARPC